MLGPLRAALGDAHAGLVDEVLEAAVVELDLRGVAHSPLLGRDDVERVDEVAHVVRRAQRGRSMSITQLGRRSARVEVEVDVGDLDARLPAVERAADLVLDAPDACRRRSTSKT